MKITGLHRGMMLVLIIPALSAMGSHKVQNYADFAAGFGAAVVGTALAYLTIHLISRD